MSSEIEAMVDEIPALRRYSRTLTGNRAAADDLVQDTLVRAIQKLHLYEQGTRLRLWLMTIMRNIFLDQYRKNKKLTLITADLGGRANDAGGPDQIDRLIHRDLVAQLQALKPEYRELLLLIGVEGLSYEEAAAVTGVPLGTVRSRLFRARNLLMRRVEGDDGVKRTSLRRAGDTIADLPLGTARDTPAEEAVGLAPSPAEPTAIGA